MVLFGVVLFNYLPPRSWWYRAARLHHFHLPFQHATTDSKSPLSTCQSPPPLYFRKKKKKYLFIIFHKEIESSCPWLSSLTCTWCSIVPCIPGHLHQCLQMCRCHGLWIYTLLHLATSPMSFFWESFAIVNKQQVRFHRIQHKDWASYRVTIRYNDGDTSWFGMLLWYLAILTLLVSIDQYTGVEAVGMVSVSASPSIF